MSHPSHLLLFARLAPLELAVDTPAAAVALAFAGIAAVDKLAAVAADNRLAAAPAVLVAVVAALTGVAD